MEQNVVVSEQGRLAPSRWVRLMPLIFITYSLAYLDRVNFGFGSAGGMAKTLGITAGVSSLLSALFFLGLHLALDRKGPPGRGEMARTSRGRNG